MRAFLIPALLALAALPLASRADEPLAAPEFEAYVQGKTLYFGLGGQPYGAEEYLPDRHVRWSFLDGRCKDGRWYEEAGMICFVYEHTSIPQCWSFFREGNGLRAVFENDPASTVLYEARQSDEPMICMGPDVGV